MNTNTNTIINTIKNAPIQELGQAALLWEYRDSDFFAELLQDDYMAYLKDRYIWDGCESDAYFIHITEWAHGFVA